METKYMNVKTGSVDNYDGWFYVSDDGDEVNAVDLGEVVEVVKDKNGNWVEPKDIPQVTWTAWNNSSFLNGERKAGSVLSAVRDARAYIRGELYGEGKASIYVDGQLVRQDEKSIFTSFRWKVTKY